MTSTASVPLRDAVPFCVAVDWGTTSFRLWVLNGAGNVLAQSRGPEGMLRAAEIGFEPVLRAHLARVGLPTGMRVLICGMAGARQGWLEAPYVPAPADVADLVAHVAPVTTDIGTVRILPGVAQGDPAAPDVMRGEETQLLGLALERPGGRNLVCVPGTHSKWVAMDGATVERFKTYLTGELFDVLARHSILKHAVDRDAPQDADGPDFLAAARRALRDAGAVSDALFTLRAGQLLGFSGRSNGAGELSGLLIGAEVGAALRRFPRPHAAVTLMASGTLAALYTAVLSEAGVAVAAADAEEASRRGLFEAARRLWA